jgi:hypothetical protein
MSNTSQQFECRGGEEGGEEDCVEPNLRAPWGRPAMRTIDGRVDRRVESRGSQVDQSKIFSPRIIFEKSTETACTRPEEKSSLHGLDSLNTTTAAVWDTLLSFESN